MTGKHVVVTGAGTGIGRAIAIRLAGDGAVVTLLARGEERLRETAARIDGATHVATCDIRERDDVERAFASAGEALGPIHALVAGSGIGGPNGEDDPGGDREIDRHQQRLGGVVAVRLARQEYLLRALHDDAQGRLVHHGGQIRRGGGSGQPQRGNRRVVDAVRSRVPLHGGREFFQFAHRDANSSRVRSVRRTPLQYIRGGRAG